MICNNPLRCNSYLLGSWIGLVLVLIGVIIWPLVPPSQICFTPGENCEKMIVDKIHAAHKSIHVQAYHITSTPIIDALNDAWYRGVNVVVIVDKTAVKEAAAFNAAMPVYVDYKPAIAHNKVIIIDGKSFITGSYNFTKAAQAHNAENALWEEDVDKTDKYEENFKRRLEVSKPI